MAKANQRVQQDPFYLPYGVVKWVDDQLSLEEHGGAGSKYQQDAEFATYSVESKGNYPLGRSQSEATGMARMTEYYPEHFYAEEQARRQQQLIQEQRDAAADAAAVAISSYMSAYGMTPDLGIAAQVASAVGRGGDPIVVITAATHDFHNKYQVPSDQERDAQKLSQVLSEMGKVYVRFTAEGLDFCRDVPDGAIGYIAPTSAQTQGYIRAHTGQMAL